ncbi:U3 snoRNP protein [Mortierella sp. AD032]|nr:U3 snoRNP protein [Mortierella sp. AD032]
MSNTHSTGTEHAVSSTTVKYPASRSRPISCMAKPCLDVFRQNIDKPVVHVPLPKLHTRIETTPQLVMCLRLLNKDGDNVEQHEGIFQDTLLDAVARLDWIKAMKRNPAEQDRWRWLAKRMAVGFMNDASKDSAEIAEIVFLGPLLDKETYRRLLSSIITTFNQADIFDTNTLQGIVYLVQSAPPESLHPDDLIRILSILRVRLLRPHNHVPYKPNSMLCPFHLTLAVSRVLDVMSDRNVEGLNRVMEREPLFEVLSGLQDSSDPFLMYQACYAFQALQYILDDETAPQAVFRHPTDVVKLDLGSVFEHLKNLQEALGGTIGTASAVSNGACSLVESGRGIFETFEEGYSSEKKRPWYVAIRVANALAQAGQLKDLNRLIYEAPCRGDPLFQWGICQLLGEITSDTIWDTTVRHQSIDLLEELYHNDPEWGQDECVNTWISKISRHVINTVSDEILKDRASIIYRNIQPTPAMRYHSYPLWNRLPLPSSSPILHRIQNVPCIMYDLHRLRLQRLEEHKRSVYIPLQAKPSLHAPDNTLFSLMEDTQEFLAGHRQVMLVLGDSGIGKSTFNLELEHTLWKGYEARGPIPLYINLPTIDHPAQDLIEKQLQYYNFSENQIQEIKLHSEVVLICDGYDESQLTINLHSTNKFNQPGQWKVKMVISCRSQYLGQDYRSRFRPQPVDRYQRSTADLFQEAVVAAFSREQIQQYVKAYVKELSDIALPQDRPSWTAEEYMDRLKNIPTLMDLVSNPFLLTLALDALPSVVESNKDLSAIRITRVQLYDSFAKRWLEVNRVRLEDSPLSEAERSELDLLLKDNFLYHGIQFQRDLSTAIFMKHAGNPVVKYTHLRDKGTWKAAFFCPDGQVKLLRESSTVTRSGMYFRFLHRSLLEYFYSRTIYDPLDYDTDAVSDDRVPICDLKACLARKNIVHEKSIIQFLAERVRQDATFQQQLLDEIEHSKTAASASFAATNAITILVRAGVRFNNMDLRGIKVPGADLSNGQFGSSQLQGADLTGANLAKTWLRQADLSGALLEGVKLGELPYLDGVTSLVVACDYSLDGGLLVAAAWSGGIIIYEKTRTLTPTWSLMHRIESNSTGINDCVFSPFCQQIASGGKDGKVRLWDLWPSRRYRNSSHGYVGGGGGMKDALWVLEGHTSGVISVSYSPSGKTIGSSSYDETVRVWSTETGQCLSIIKGHAYDVVSVNYLSTKALSVHHLSTTPCLVLASMDETIRFWHASGRTGAVWRSRIGRFLCLAYSADGRTIASGYVNGNVQLWDAETGDLGPAFYGHTDGVTSVAFSSSGNWLASTSGDRTVRIWDVSAGALISTLTGHCGGVYKVAFSPDERQMVSVGADMRARLWELDFKGLSLSVTEQPQDQRAGALAVAFTPNGQKVLSVDDALYVRQWDPLAGAHGLDLHMSDDTCEDTFYLWCAAFSPDGRQIATAADEGPIRLTSLEPGAASGRILKGHLRAATRITYSPCGRWMVSCGLDKTVRLWDLHDSTPSRHDIIAELGDDDVDDFDCLAFSSTGRQFAVGYPDGVVRLFDPQSRTIVESTSFSNERLSVLAYSPCGQQLAVGTSTTNSIFIWNLQSSELSVELHGHNKPVRCIAYTPCVQWIVSGSDDATVRLWQRQQPSSSAQTWSCVSVVRGFFGTICDIAWNPVEPLEFVTACKDGSVRVWKVSSDNKSTVVKALWGSSLEVLCAADMIFMDATRLTSIQRGAIASTLDVKK